MLGDLLLLSQTGFFPKALDVLFKLWPAWVPIIVLNVTFDIWLGYIQRLWLNKQGSVLLEIKLPKDQPKSPAAMEFVLQGIWENANISTPADAFWEGKMREWFSLEIVSIGGEVRFFIWALPRWKKIIESRIYAQYPGAEVVEVKDYALDLMYDPDKFYYWGITTKLNKADAYPIKTYIEYELDKKKGDEQEEIVDPITPVVEYLGTLGPHEVGGIQILIRAHASENYLYGRISTKKDWRDSIKKEIKNIVEKEALITPEKDKPASLLALTDTQKETIKAMERNAGKLAFDSMIRMLYVAPKDNYEKTRGIGMIGSTRQFSSGNLNGIRPDVFMSITHAWQDFNDIRKRELQSTHLDAYKRRAFFGPVHHHLKGKPYVLTTEEVATLFHLPGAVATTPNLRRAPSKKAEAPANLPL
ncbi:MAG: hypothetical protein AAB758_01355 [Patescibacteria group bacterium]